MSGKPLQSVSGRRQALEDRFPAWPRHTLARHFDAACRRYGERAYFHIDDVTISYAQLWRDAIDYAKAFIGLGVQRRDHVAVLAGNHAAFPSLMIAANIVGAVFIPVNVMQSDDELAYVLSQSDTRFLIVQGAGAGRDLGASTARSMAADELPELRRIISLDDDCPAPILPWTGFLDHATGISDAELHARWALSIYPDEVAIILYTSGSTGHPKGVMLSDDMLLRCAYGTCLSRAIEDGRVTFAPLPFYHCFALVESILAMSFVGGSFISAPGASPLKSLQLMERHKANDYLCVPSTLVALLNHPRVAQFDLSSLFALWCGATSAPVQVWERACRVLGVTEIITGYGQTEVSSSGVTTEVGDPLERIASRVGRPKPGGVSGLPEFGGSAVQYKTVDIDTGANLAPGAVGELAVRGATVTRGYYRKPDETAQAIDKDGWLRTGDVGRIDADGYLEVIGRRRGMYKVSGELVAPREIEIAISAHPAVNEVQVVGVPSALTGEAGAAFIELKAGVTCTRRDIVAWCTTRLARFKVPRHIWFVTADAWPMTGSGKIRKYRLQDMARQRLAHDTAA